MSQSTHGSAEGAWPRVRAPQAGAKILGSGTPRGRGTHIRIDVTRSSTFFCLLGQCAAPREIQFAGVGTHGNPVETSGLLRAQIWPKISVRLLPEASWSHLPRIVLRLGLGPPRTSNVVAVICRWSRFSPNFASSDPVIASSRTSLLPRRGLRLRRAHQPGREPARAGQRGRRVGVAVGDFRSSRRAVAGVCPRFGVSSTRGLVLHWRVCVGYGRSAVSCSGGPAGRGGGALRLALTRLGIGVPKAIADHAMVHNFSPCHPAWAMSPPATRAPGGPRRSKTFTGPRMSPPPWVARASRFLQI